MENLGKKLKKYESYKNGFLEWGRSKKIVSKSSIYNTFIEKPCIKHLKNIDLLHKLPFYNELDIEKISKAFKRYARSYKIEIIGSKDRLVQLEASKSSIKDLSKDLPDDIKGFKYQILLRKHKENGGIVLASGYFNSTTKTAINSYKYDLNKSFQEILYRIDNWINEGSCWITESMGE